MQYLIICLSHEEKKCCRCTDKVKVSTADCKILLNTCIKENKWPRFMTEQSRFLVNYEGTNGLLKVWRNAFHLLTWTQIIHQLFRRRTRDTTGVLTNYPGHTISAHVRPKKTGLTWNPTNWAWHRKPGQLQAKQKKQLWQL